MVRRIVATVVIELLAVSLMMSMANSGSLPVASEGVNEQVSDQTKILPHARGKTFSKLDDYLAHLKELGAMDIPYFELQQDGRYRLITGRGGNRVPPVYFTRDELMKKFGFSE